MTGMAKQKKEAKKKTSSGAGSKKKSRKRTPERRSLARRVIRAVILVFVVTTLLGGAVFALMFWSYSRSLPGIFAYSDYTPKEMSVILDRHGVPLLELYDERRTVIPFEDIPDEMKKAMISAEDADFYHHKGLDYIGIARAVLVAVKNRGARQGASTITQQVVKNLILTPERSMSRKFQEAMLARQIEQSLTKDEILAIYLNHVYFGHRNYGVEQAALFYFGVHARDLTLNQAATLAGLVQSPERLSPVKHMDKAVTRRNYVLRQMFEKGHIAEDVYRAALEESITLAHHDDSSLGAAPYFTEHIRQSLIAEYGRDYVYNAGLVITTTLDLDLQRKAEAAFQKGLMAFDERHYMNRPLKNPSSKAPKKYEKNKNYEAKISRIDGDTVFFTIADKELPYTPTSRQKKHAPLGETFRVGQTWFVQILSFDDHGKPEKIMIPSGANGALIAIDVNTHEIRAMVGGYDYRESVFNRATQAQRQTGSSFKTFVYGAALEARVITPATIIDDAPKVFHIPGQKKPWSAKNSDNKYKGPMTTRTALAQSRNTVAVDVLERTGIDKTIQFVRKFGIESPLVENYTLALGSSSMTDLDVTNAYATIASGGTYKSPKFVLSITRHGESLKTPPQTQHKAIEPDVAYVLSSMLKSVATEGTARRQLGKWTFDVAGKTGTTNSTKDAWFVGFTSQLACGVYVGYDDPKPLGRGEGGSTTALPIFADFMAAAHKDARPADFEKPDNVIQVPVDASTGLLPGSRPTRDEVFLNGTQPVAQAQDEDIAQDWMMRQLAPTPSSDDPAEDVGSEDDSDAF